MVPAEFRRWLLMNPLFHFIEISRECFSDSASYTPFGDMAYLFQCSLVSITIGLGFYLLLRKKMMIEMMEN